MNCLLTTLTVISSLQYPSNEWKDIRVYTSQKMVVPQEEFVLAAEKMITPRMKKTVTKTLVCGDEVEGVTSSYLSLTDKKEVK